jgi:phosphoglycerate dehydrogenase-like enzyme
MPFGQGEGMTPASRPFTVAVLDDYQDAAHRFGRWETLGSAVELTVFRDHVADEAALVARLAPFDVVCCMRERTLLPAHVIDALPRLKLLVTTAFWNAAVDIEHAVAKGITVCGTESVLSGTPELTWLLILSLARRFEAERASVRAGGWQTDVGLDLKGRTLGVVGLGKIGSHVAAVANLFGMNVLAWSQNLTAERARACSATLVDKSTLLAQSDFVTVHLKLSERTRHVIGDAELRTMKPTAYLVNTSRGPLVDETALVDALRSGRVAGAGLDAFDIEPLPMRHPFRMLPNVVATPHIGYVTQAGYELFWKQIVDNIRAWIDGAPVRTLGGASGSPR